jgi:GNAT superfamily N-acetyltransferase
LGLLEDVVPLTTYQLSPASLDDCLEISRCFQDKASITEWGGEGFVFPVQQQQFLLQLHRPQTRCFVLKNESVAVGFGQICQRFGKHHLARLLVLPAARGQKLSYGLILSLIFEALQLNLKLDFSLFVFRHNTIAIHCYQQLGFQISKQPGPEHPGLYFMQLSYAKAIRLLENANWQFYYHAELMHCQQKDDTYANLD